MSAYVSTAKPYKGMGMEGAVAKWYAALTKKSLEDFKFWPGARQNKLRRRAAFSKLLRTGIFRDRIGKTR